MSSNEFGSERSKPWDIYTSSDPSPSQAVVDQEAPWKNFGTSMNAISFGFVATAILISMFLIMAIFEHLFRPNPSFSSPQVMMSNGSSGSGPKKKLGNEQTLSTSYASDFSVLMPGQQYPTYIAQPAPLPCPREEINWPSHEHNNFVCP
ncbi:Multidrug resistance 3 [Melia azedarach]|uniref:Multidrug resistance 3 n=3 Tax=Melia azedarach TaxID=155640 RepID=A0ACC1Y2T3_MELAZ|nr:Multidrug resistance 3 [Melia azedarach]KAJ4717474.1 Multidrug resistance 3 [Melia azedarach]KAJ4717475.1 Multidrug resistance 3 [Melia azedarach]